MDASVRYTVFSPGYADQVFDLILAIQRDEFGIAITREAQPDLARIPENYQHGSGNFWLALEEDAVVGTIALLDIGDSQVALRKMFVRADYRGRGVAQALLQLALGWAGERGVGDVFLGTTAQFLAAQRFYEKNGFAAIAKAELPTRFPVMTVDTVFYRRRIRAE